MEWAQEVGNPHMVSYVLVRKADQAAATRDAPRTIGLAQSALQHGRRLTSRGRAVALQQLAVGYALAGDEVACQRALDTAAQLAERSQQDHDEGPGRYCTPAYVEIQRAATWIELGRPERAITLFEDSLARLPSVHRRDRGVYLARLASAYALSGSPDTSVPKGWEALTVAQATGSRRITTELGQLGSRLTRWESMPRGQSATQGVAGGMSERPFILWKCAASLDGRIAAADGSSKWITSAEARADGHRLRAECGAVMVGSGTQQADDPQLAVRDAEVTRQPLRIVVDSNARTPASARVLDDAAPTLIAVAEDADASHLEGRAEIVRLPRVDAGLDLELLLKALSERGVRAILLEGGPTLAGSFLAAGLIDRVVAYIAPVLIGGGGKPALAGPGAPNIADAKRFQLEDVVRIGPDVRLTATPLTLTSSVAAASIERRTKPALTQSLEVSSLHLKAGPAGGRLRRPSSRRQRHDGHRGTASPSPYGSTQRITAVMTQRVPPTGSGPTEPPSRQQAHLGIPPANRVQHSSLQPTTQAATA